MNPPATVIRQSSRKAALVVITLASFSLGFLGTAVKAQTNQSRGAVPQTDGTYLYGQTPQPNQMSKGYVVFQRQKGKVVGATYSPYSEFNCFTGSSTKDTLNVKSVSVGESSLGNVKINLATLHSIKPVSANDQRMLSACKQAVNNQ